MGLTRILFILALIYLGYRVVTVAGRIIYRLGRAAGRHQSKPDEAASPKSQRINTDAASDADFEELNDR